MITLRIVSLAVALLGAAACGGPLTYSATGQPPAQGADAKITVEAIQAGNRKVRVDFKHLPPPDRLQADVHHYAVWLLPEGREIQLAGMLAHDPDKRTGFYETTTPFATFEILVTAEQSAQPQAPGRVIIIRQQVSSGEDE